MTNHFFAAIHAETQHDQLHHYHQFLEAEMATITDRLQDLENEDGSIPDEHAEQWSYEKGQLDFCRTLFGLVVQSRLLHEQRSEAEADE